MSENEQRRVRDLSQYDSMTTEALEQILRADAEAPAEQESDIELILYIMEVLARRKKENQQSGKTAQQAWESFRQHYFPEQEIQERRNVSSRPWLRRMIACAATVILILCIPLSTRAFSFEELWDVVARWAKETFSFVSGDAEQVSEPEATDAIEYTSLRDLLERNEVDSNIIPSWIPDGFVLEKVEKNITPQEEIYRSTYTRGNQKFKIIIRTFMPSDQHVFEIEKETSEIYESSGVNYYIFQNKDQLRSVWISNAYECNISGDLSVDEIKKMIDSIGEEP